jgi:hypothetical protein
MIIINLRNYFAKKEVGKITILKRKKKLNMINIPKII